MNEISNNLISAIQDSVKAEILTDAFGNQHSTRQIYPINPRNLPDPATIQVATLF